MELILLVTIGVGLCLGTKYIPQSTKIPFIFLMMTLGYISPSICNSETVDQASAKNQSTPNPINAIHIDSISIDSEKKASDSFDDNDRERMTYELMDGARAELISWMKWQTFFAAMLVILGIPGFIYVLLKDFLNSLLTRKIEALEEARNETLMATKKAIEELKQLKDTINDLAALEKTVESDVRKRQTEIDDIKILSEQYKNNLSNWYKDITLDIDDKSNFLTTANTANSKWLNAIDVNYEAANKVIDELIDQLLNSPELDERLTALEQLSHFDDKDSRILKALKEILEKQVESAITTEALSLIGQSNHIEDAFNILEPMPCKLFDTDTAAVLGALGNLQERSSDEGFVKKIADKLIALLNDYVNYQPKNNAEKSELANTINAVMSALTYSNEYAEPAIPLLIQLIDDESENEYKMTAAIVLGDLREKAQKAVPALERLKTNINPAFSVAAEEAIAKIKSINA